MPTEIERRLDRIEARQRAYSMHDPNCPRFRAMVAQRNTPGLAFTFPKCSCWLTEETTP